MTHEPSKYWFDMTDTKKQKHGDDRGTSRGKIMNYWAIFIILFISLSVIMCDSLCVCAIYKFFVSVYFVT